MVLSPWKTVKPLSLVYFNPINTCFLKFWGTFNLFSYFHLISPWILQASSSMVAGFPRPHPKSQGHGACISRLSLKSHLGSILVSSNVQGSHDAQPTFKGRKYTSSFVQEVQNSRYTCDIFLQKFLENTVCHTHRLSEQIVHKKAEKNREYLHSLS